MSWQDVLKIEYNNWKLVQATYNAQVNPENIEKFANLVVDILEKKDIKSIYGDNIDEYIREGNFDMNKPQDILRLSEGVNKEQSKSWRDNYKNFPGGIARFKYETLPGSRFWRKRWEYGF